MATAGTQTEAWANARPAVRARARWQLLARPAQLTPPGDWNVWLFMAGRGAGKTRSAAEDMAYWGVTHPGHRLAVVGPTYADARDTCVEGESGLLACLPRSDVQTWNRSLGELVLTNGARYKLFSGDEPDRLRGPQFHRAWCDELAAFRYDDAWDMLQMGLRLGGRPQTVVTTTPRPRGLIRDLVARPDVIVTRGSTWDNAANLAPAAVEALRRRYHGTRLGRQELEGHLIDDVEGALWKRAWIDDQRVDHTGHVKFWQRRVMGLDPADGIETGDEQALTICAQGSDWGYYVLRSEGTRDTALGWLSHCLRVARDEQVDSMIVEKNHGGQFLVELLEQAIRATGIRVPYRVVTASQGKRTRAEPVAGVYEQGRVRHVGAFPELEDQMTTWLPGEKSPDRMDSLVWAMHDLLGLADGPSEAAVFEAVPFTEATNAEWGAVPYR